MAKTETLTLKVEAELQSALADVKRLEKEVEKLRRTAEKPIDIELDAGDAERTVDGLLKTVQKLSGEDAQIVLAIKGAEIQQEINDIRVDLATLNSTDAEIEIQVANLGQLQGDLEKVEGAIKEIDGAKAEVSVTADTTQATQGMATARGEIDAIPRSAGGANSALANMYGNVAGEAGAVFGALGPVNVAIGQMAEYAADAKFAGEGLGSALGSMAKVAGPIAVLSAGLQVVSTVMDGIKVREAFEAGLVEDFTESLREAETVAQSIFETVRETGELEFVTQGGGILGLGQQVEDLLPTLDNLNITVADFIRLAEQVDLSTLFGGTTTGPAGAVSGILDMDEAIKVLGLDSNASEEDVGNLLVAIEQYAAGTATAEETQRRINEVLSVSPELAREATEAWLAAQDPISQFPDEFNRIAAALQQGAIPAAKDLETVSEGLSISLADVLDIASDIPAEFDKTADATERINRLNDQFVDDINERIAAQEELNAEQDRMTLSTEELADALLALEDPAEALPGVWERLVDELGKGAVDLELTKDLTDQLAQATGLAAEDIIAMAVAEAQLREEKLNEQLEEDAAAAEELAAALSLVEEELNSAAGRADAFQAALDRIQGPGELTSGQEINDFVDGLEGMTEALSHLDIEALNLGEIDILPPGDDWQAWLNMPDEGQAVIDAMAGFREQINSEMSQAFTAGGAQGAREWADNTRRAVTDQLIAMGITSEDAINQVLSALNLLPEQVDLEVNIAIDEQKLAIIDDVTGALEGIPPQVMANVQMAINNKDPDEALRILNEHLLSVGEEPVTITYNADTGEFDIQMAEATTPRTVEVLISPRLISEVADPRMARNIPDVPAAAPGTQTVTVTAELDPGTVDRDLDTLAAERKAPIKAEATQVLSVDAKLDAIAKLRTAIIEAEASGVFLTEGKLDNLADPRTARITADARTGQAEFDLNRVARDRHSTVHVHMVTNPTGEPLSPNPQTAMEQLAAEATVEPMALAATPLAADIGAGAVTSTTAGAPAVVRVPAPAPVTNNYFSVEVRAAVVGNRYETERVIAKSMRSYARLNGTRN